MANEQKIIVGIETKADLTGVDQTKKAIEEVGESGSNSMDKTSTSAKRIGQSLEGSAKQAKSAGGSLNQAMGKFGQTIEGSISGVKKLGATLQSIVSGFGWIGVITAAFAQLKSLYEWWNSAEIEKEAKQKEHAENEKSRQKEIAEAANRSLIEINNQRATEKQIETVKKLNTELTETTKEIERQLQLKLDYLDAEQGIYDANQNLKRAKVENDYQNKVLDITKNTKLSDDDRDYALRSAKRDRDTEMNSLNDEQELRRQNVALQKSTATLEAMTNQVYNLSDTIQQSKQDIANKTSGVLTQEEWAKTTKDLTSLKEAFDPIKDDIAQQIVTATTEKNKSIKEGRLDDADRYIADEDRLTKLFESYHNAIRENEKKLEETREKFKENGYKGTDQENIKSFWDAIEQAKNEVKKLEQTRSQKNLEADRLVIQVDTQTKANQVNESTIQTNKQTRAATYQAEDETYRQQQIQKREAQDKANNPLLNLIDKNAPADSLQGGKSRFAEALISVLKNNILSSDEVAEIKKLMEELQANNMGSIIDEVLNTATQKKDISASLVNQLKELSPSKNTTADAEKMMEQVAQLIQSGGLSKNEEAKARDIMSGLQKILSSKDKNGDRINDKEMSAIQKQLTLLESNFAQGRNLNLQPVAALLQSIANTQMATASQMEALNNKAITMQAQIKTMQSQARNSR